MYQQRPAHDDRTIAIFLLEIKHGIMYKILTGELM